MESRMGKRTRQQQQQQQQPPGHSLQSLWLSLSSLSPPGTETNQPDVGFGLASPSASEPVGRSVVASFLASILSLDPSITQSHSHARSLSLGHPISRPHHLFVGAGELSCFLCLSTNRLSPSCTHPSGLAPRLASPLLPPPHHHHQHQLRLAPP